MSAQAQVTVNPQALEPPGTETPPPPRPLHPPPRPTHPPPPHARPPATHPAAAAPPKPPPIVVPPVPPPVAVLAPLVPPPPAHPTAPPPPAPVVAGAVGEVAALPTGIRVTFGTGSADLNAATAAALRQVARDSPHGVFTVTAFTPGKPEDPSTPRRLSLDRALAARSLLINEGIPSTQIEVRARQFGPGEPEGPPDRVDVTVAIPANPSPAAVQAAAPGKPP